LDRKSITISPYVLKLGTENQKLGTEELKKIELDWIPKIT
jgi:hypothetical protein